MNGSLSRLTSARSIIAEAIDNISAGDTAGALRNMGEAFDIINGVVGDTVCDIVESEIKNNSMSREYLQLMLDSMPETVRDRVRRRMAVARDNTDNDGHSKTPHFSKRISPKREKQRGEQMQGRGKLGHRHSTRRQRQNGH